MTGQKTMKYIKRLATLAAITVTALVASPAFAWGQAGHLTVCDLAYRNLTDNARSAVDDLLHGGITFPAKGNGQMGTAKRTYTAFNVGCLEEDTIPRRDAAEHFINYKRNQKAVTDSQCPAKDDGSPGDCIFVGITAARATLADGTKSRADRVDALMSLGHWIGDIHQPLHVSFEDDQGGNNLDTTKTVRCGTSKATVTNLHAVWDKCLLEAGLFEAVRQTARYKTAAASGHPWGPRTITYRAVDTLYDTTTLAEETAWDSSEPWQWAQESFETTILPAINYCIMVGENCQYSQVSVTLANKAAHRAIRVDQAYLDKFSGLTTERVQRAGHRLAHLLNLALDPNYQRPRDNAVAQGVGQVKAKVSP